MKMFLIVSLLTAATNLASIKLKMDITIGTDEKFSETLVVPAGEWVTKKFGKYSLKTKAEPQPKAGVKVQTEITISPTAKPWSPTIIANWGEAAKVGVTGDDKKPVYELTVVASRNHLSDTVD